MAKHKRNHNKVSRNSAVNMPATNRNYKDTIFRMLFSDRKNLLSLYNAVNQSNYNNPDDLEIVTLENAIYMGMKNDLAFIMDTNLYLYEHQSTYNPNMPLRDLFYICSEYQKLVDKKSLYSSTLQKIPAQASLSPATDPRSAPAMISIALMCSASVSAHAPRVIYPSIA